MGIKGEPDDEVPDFQDPRLEITPSCHLKDSGGLWLRTKYSLGELYQPFTTPSVVLDVATGLKCTSSHPKKNWDFMMIFYMFIRRKNGLIVTLIAMFHGALPARPQFVARLVGSRHSGTFQRSASFHSIDLFVLFADGRLGFASCRADFANRLKR